MTQLNDTRFVKDVVSYYKKHGRHDLVWRKKITPYRILVSEIMLQQTQVTRVLPKFEVWMKRYPTLRALKDARLTDVLLLWQGLGYQRRAKALHTIAQTETKIPRTFDALCALRGVGTYTASAVLAFAYDTFEHPLLETNIRTALIETFFKDHEQVDDKTLYDVLRQLEEHPQVKRLGARVWYYALMDYGAMLKTQNISHNAKVKGYTKQTPYKGSTRELRAKLLFAIAEKRPLGEDARNAVILAQLEKEGYIAKKGKTYQIS